MSVPRQVEEAAELAQTLHSQMFAQPEEVENEQEETVVEQEEVQEEPAAPESNTEAEDFKHKYEVLQGKYNAEVPKLNQELRELKDKVFGFFEAQKQQPAAQPEVKVDPRQEKIEKYRSEYGDEVYEMAKLVAEIEADRLLSERIQPVQQHVQEVEETQIAAAQQNFVDYLSAKVKGDWQTLWSGQDQKFIDFLQQPDPSGLYTYGDLVRAYNDNWDADRLATVFNTYFDSQQPKQAPQQERQVQKPNPAKEAIVAPPRNTQAPAPKAEEKTIWTQDMIREFQKADRMGKYDKDTSEAMWQDLLAAPMENRIR